MMCAPLPLNIYYKNKTTMKKMMMAFAVATILLSCNKDDEPSQVPSGGRIAIVIPADSMENHATITFGCSTTTTAIRPMTRATLSSISLTDLWVYDLPSGQTTPTLLAHQTSEDADFGAPTITAEYGDHTFYFVASRGDTPTTDGTTITWAKPSDTFWSSLTMTVAPSTIHAGAMGDVALLGRPQTEVQQLNSGATYNGASIPLQLAVSSLGNITEVVFENFEVPSPVSNEDFLSLLHTYFKNSAEEMKEQKNA